MTHPLLDPNRQLVIAHRGNRARAPENSIAGLREAVELGADGLEFDVRVTRDGVVVLMHDPTLDRTTTGRGRLADVDFGELGDLTIRQADGSAGTKVPVPTLEEVLDQFRGTPLVIDVKERRAAEETIRLVHKLGLASSIVAGSELTDVAQRLYRSGIPACASRTDALLMIPMAMAGVMPFTPDYSLLSLTPRWYGWPIPVGRMAAAARRRGMPTHVWTVNDAAEARAFWRAGVTGVTTDDPAAMIRARAQ